MGTLFIVATAAGVLSVALRGAPDADSLADVAAHRHRTALGALMIVVMAAAIALIPAILYPVLRRHDEGLAVGYVVTRTLEVVLILPAALGPLLLVSSDAHPGILATLVSTYGHWWAPVSSVFFCLSAALLNVLLFRSRLVPRLISGWGLVAVAPYLAAAPLVVFGVLAPSSPSHALLVAPLALNEMVLALWLLAKGFRPPVAGS
ncbi:DUF4386 domain-containing protein [Longispora sp. NPDC051575]|uniref:DUF4386 domain-containing protein n=1 Tax=Longispora sp. NPDC051575 TaxID=3154943 RepID=UPI003445FE21